MPDTPSSWFTGVMVPVTTPFDPVTGEIAPVHFCENLRRWIEAPLDGIVVFGTNGEGKLLDTDEKLRLMGFARDLVPPRMPLIAGAAGESTRGTIADVRRLADAGADAVLVAPPVYFGPILSPAALRDHFLAVADASPIPVILYHIPKYTHVAMEAGLVGELSRHERIVALKDSSGDLKRFADYTTACGPDFKLLVGNGALLYTALELGAAGGVVALGLFAPEGCAAIHRNFRNGDTRAAGEIQTRLAPAHKEIVARYGPVGTKAALDLLGYAGGRPRPPLSPIGEKDQRHVVQVLQQTGLM